MVRRLEDIDASEGVTVHIIENTHKDADSVTIKNNNGTDSVIITKHAKSINDDETIKEDVANVSHTLIGVPMGAEGGSRA